MNVSFGTFFTLREGLTRFSTCGLTLSDAKCNNNCKSFRCLLAFVSREVWGLFRNFNPCINIFAFHFWYFQKTKRRKTVRRRLMW